jgi:hypothetical protein
VFCTGNKENELKKKKKRRQDLAKIEDEGTNAVEIYKLIRN